MKYISKVSRGIRGSFSLKGGHLVEALYYKPEGRGFDTRWCHWNFNWHYRSERTMALGLTQSLTVMNTRNISWGVKAVGV